jgi:sialate O-acetylesterase
MQPHTKQLLLSSLFGDHAVLQQGVPVPVSGWAEPLNAIEVRCAQIVARGMSNADGEFCVRLPAMPAGGPYELEVRNLETGETCKSSDVMVGEVWLASGQSNMEWTFKMTGEAAEAHISTVNNPHIRMLTVPRQAIWGGRRDIKANWQTLSAPDSLDFSAVATYFAQKLQAELGVAIGILNASWGGTPVEAWLSRNALAQNPFLQSRFARYEADLSDPDYWQGLNQHQRNAFPADPGNHAEEAGWAMPSCDESSWPEVQIPNPWMVFGHNHSGVFWFRKSLKIPQAWVGKELILKLGAIDKQDVSYFNGVQIGVTGKDFEEEHWNTPREYTIPRKLVKSDSVTLAVRVFSFVYQGGLIGPMDTMCLHPVDQPRERIPLGGSWRYQMEHNLGVVHPPGLPFGPGNPNTPHILYDSMLKPLRSFAMRGAIWYQGESNADRANEYTSLLRDMIKNWRADWGLGDFAFLIVQLANFRAASDFDSSSTWARLREAQLQALQEPNTGLAVAIDIGEAADIHPKNKKDVGERLALGALAKAYAREIPYSGPIYRNMVLEAKGIRLFFDHASGGLLAKDGNLKTFVIAGKDRVFSPAEASVDGYSVFVSSPQVPFPEAVRYAWADNPEGCNLFNGAGLPASPFRTDNWL